MASLQITAFRGASNMAIGEVHLEELVTITGTSAQSTVLPVGGANAKNTKFSVRLISDVDCFVTWGTNPTALINGSAGRMLGAENPEYFSISTGDKIAVIERV